MRTFTPVITTEGDGEQIVGCEYPNQQLPLADKLNRMINLPRYYEWTPLQTFRCDLYVRMCKAKIGHTELVGKCGTVYLN
jgi:hypothetical protein